MQKILDMHSQVYAGPEFDFLTDLCGLYIKMKRGLDTGRQVFYYDSSTIKHQFSHLIQELILSKHRPKGITLLSEKTPSNVLVFDELKELFPKAQFIFVVRDPRGNINSFMEVAKRAKAFGDNIAVGNNLLDDLHLIDNYISAGNSFYLRNRDRCYLIHYEALLLAPCAEVKKLCLFLQIPFEESMLDMSVINDTSTLVNNQNATVRAWSTPGMLDSPIKQGPADKWKGNMSSGAIRFISHFFAGKRYECYDYYSLKRLIKVQKLSLINTYAQNRGLRFLFKKAYEYVKNN